MKIRANLYETSCRKASMKIIGKKVKIVKWHNKTLLIDSAL